MPLEAQAAVNPFGAMVGATSDSLRVTVAHDLGAKYYRTHKALVLSGVDAWGGSCPECDAATQANPQLFHVMTIKHNAVQTLGQPTTPPVHMNSYKQELGQALDALDPEVLVVENEEDNDAYYGGTAEQYGEQLVAACEVAHARQIACTDGGISGRRLMITIYEDLYATSPAAANAFADKAANTESEHAMLTSRRVDRVLSRQQSAARGQAFLDAVAAAAPDYVNFHWYQHDAAALADAIDWIEAETGLPAMTNELGKRLANGDDAVWRIESTPTTHTHGYEGQIVESLMTKVMEKCLPYAIWFSIDLSGDVGVQTSALHDRTTGTLRPGGLAFQSFVGTIPGLPAC